MGTVLDLIGCTPTIELQRLNPPNGATIIAKWERFNPGGSVKDRPAYRIISEAREMGLIPRTGTLIESSSGNFGVSIAMVGAVYGYKTIILVDPKTTDANLSVLSTLGAEVIVVHEQDDTGSYHKTRIKLANELAEKIPGAFRPDQCFNLFNSRAHFDDTGPELLGQIDSSCKALIATVSTGGQIGGLSRLLKASRPDIQIIGADATGSGIFGGPTAPYRTPGVGLGWTPTNVRVDLVDRAVKVPDDLTFQGCRLLARNEGILAGASSGMAFAAAVKVASELDENASVACIFPDGGDRYLTTVYSDSWLESIGVDSSPTFARFVESCMSLPWISCLEHQSPTGGETALEKRLGIPHSTERMSKESYI